MHPSTPKGWQHINTVCYANHATIWEDVVRKYRENMYTNKPKWSHKQM